MKTLSQIFQHGKKKDGTDSDEALDDSGIELKSLAMMFHDDLTDLEKRMKMTTLTEEAGESSICGHMAEDNTTGTSRQCSGEGEIEKKEMKLQHDSTPEPTNHVDDSCSKEDRLTEGRDESREADMNESCDDHPGPVLKKESVVVAQNEESHSKTPKSDMNHVVDHNLNFEAA